MINSFELLRFFRKKKITFFAGVPDSVLQNFSETLNTEKHHYICPNEGSAIALTIGNYLSTGQLGLCYFQNSGLSNAINPIISIAHRKVYSIPLILMIGWRGAPRQKDEPQHVAKGRITRTLLKNLNIKNSVINSYKDFKKILVLIKFSKKKKVPVAILFKNKIFLENKKKINKIKKNLFPTREQVILEILSLVSKEDKIISTTGYTSRELFNLRTLNKNDNGKDFYMVGGMGHASMVALGSSLKEKNKVICLDGDGSLLMHMGSLVTIGANAKKNFKYILLNNGAHESVGGQSTGAEKLNFSLLSKSLNFKSYFLINNIKNYKKKLKIFFKSNKGPSFLEIRIKIKSINNLTRPTDLISVKNNFMKK